MFSGSRPAFQTTGWKIDPRPLSDLYRCFRLFIDCRQLDKSSLNLRVIHASSIVRILFSTWHFV